MSSSSSLSSSAGSNSSATATYSRGVRLRRSAQARYSDANVDGYRFQVTAYGAYLMPNEIFRYVRRPLNINTGEQADEFDGTCSPVDLDEFPIGEPIGTPPFTRKSSLDLVFRSQSQAEEAWTAIKEEVASLVNTLNLMDELVVDEDIAVGNPPPA